MEFKALFASQFNVQSELRVDIGGVMLKYKHCCSVGFLNTALFVRAAQLVDINLNQCCEFGAERPVSSVTEGM